MLSEYSQLSAAYIEQIVEYMWVNDVLLIAVPFVIGMALLRCFPQFFPKSVSAKNARAANKLRELTDHETSEDSSQTADSSELSLKSSAAWEAELAQEMESHMRAEHEEEIVADNMARLNADMMADLVADEHDDL